METRSGGRDETLNILQIKRHVLVTQQSHFEPTFVERCVQDSTVSRHNHS
jgi:hypothetical protein